MIKVPDGTLRILVQGLQPRSGSSSRSRTSPYLVGRVRRDCPTIGAETPRGRGAHPQRAEPLRAHHRPVAVPARGAAARGREHRRPERALPPRRLDAADEDRGAQELLETADVEERLREVSLILNREVEVVELGTKIQSQVASRDREGPARVLPAPAAEGDPGGARRGRRPAGRDQRAARADRAEATCPRRCARRSTGS